MDSAADNWPLWQDYIRDLEKEEEEQKKKEKVLFTTTFLLTFYPTSIY